MKPHFSFTAIGLLFVATSTIAQQPPAPAKPADGAGAVIVSGLDQPTGIAVQPGTGDLFIADSGAGQILRFDPSNPDKGAVPVITGWPGNAAGNGPYGGWSIAFLGRDLLVVTERGKTPADSGLRFFPTPTADKPLKSTAGQSLAAPPAATGDNTKPDHNFCAVTAVAGLFMARGDDSHGAILNCELNAQHPLALKPAIDTRAAVGIGGPFSLTMDRTGNLVAGFMGPTGNAKDSLLAFFNPATGTPLMKLNADLYDIAGLAYSTRSTTGNSTSKTFPLYAVDLATAKPSEAGLFRLDAKPLSDGTEGINATRIATLDTPSALAFAADGTLYVTVVGTAKAGEKNKLGRIVKFTGL